MGYYINIIIIGLCCVRIAFEDYKYREVYAHWLSILILAMGYLLYTKTLASVFIMNLAINLSIVLFIILLLYGYAKLKMKRKLAQVFGLGDVLMLVAYAVGFGNLSFIVLLFFSVMAALVIHLSLKPKKENIPLAGHMAIILILVYGTQFYFDTHYIFHL